MLTSAARRVVVALLLGATLVAVDAPRPAQADEVSRAQQRVNQLQDQVAVTTRRMLEGTRRWEQDRAALQATRTKLAASRAQVRAAEREMAEGRHRLGVVARRLYMSPGSNTLLTTPDEMLEKLRAEESLSQVGQNDAQVILRARTARGRLARIQRTVEVLVADAQQLERRSATQLRELNALADTMARQLVAAEQALVGARGRKEARLAAARAARARALRMRYASHGALCTNRSTAGMANGNLDPAALCPLWQAPGHRLRADAAAAFNRMSKFHAKTKGAPLCVTDSYRSYSQQVDVYHRKPGLAAVPGTSEHGWGKAVDFCGGIQTYGSPAFRWMKANAGRFGWFHPDWAEPSGSKPEAWHWEFRG